MKHLRGRGIALAGILVAAGALPAGAQSASNDVMVLDLETAQRIALSENPSLQSAEARVRRAEARLAQVQATFWPTIGAGASALRNRRSDTTVGELEDARSPLADDYQQRLDEVIREISGDIARANVKALSRVRADQLSRLEGKPALQQLQQAAFAETDRLGSLYLDSIENELANFRPLESAVDALGIEAAPPVDQTVDSYRAGAYGSWLLFDGFSRRYSRSVARYGREGSEAAHRDARRLLLGAVARAYYQAQLVREERTIAEADLEFNARLLEEARRRRDVGQSSLSTVLNFEVRCNIAEISMVNARRKYAANRVALATLLGFPDAALPESIELAPLADEQPEEMAPPDTAEAIAYALTNRSDVAVARLAVRQGKSGVRLAKSAYSPSLSLNGQYSGYRTDDASFEEEDFGAAVGVVLTYQLFEGGARRAQVREAAAVAAEAQSTLDQVELTAAAEVRSAIVTLTYAGELLKLQRRSLAIVEQTRDLVELEFKANHASVVRLNQSQRELVEARARYATALASLHVAWNDLLQATGRSLESLEE